MIRPHGPVGFRTIARTMLRKYPTRSLLGLAMIMSQAFLYNGVSFAFALILAKFYGVPEARVGLYLLPFALGNFLGPLLLGRLFDTVGRKPMIIGTYAISAVLLVISGLLFERGALNATGQTLTWGLIFFFASTAAASSAYLTVSEVVPLELRGMAIALFYSAGTALGGPLASWLFGYLIDRGQRVYVFYGDLLARGRPRASPWSLGSWSSGGSSSRSRPRRASLGRSSPSRCLTASTRQPLPVPLDPVDGVLCAGRLL